MSDRNLRIIEAAGKLFSRYGVGKTTMNDIAKEAGVARQTLYNSYPGKEEVLRAVVRDNIDTTFAAVTRSWDSAESFGQKLDAFFEAGPLHWYDLVRSSPEMAELLDGLHIVAKHELEYAAKQWTAAFAEALTSEGVSSHKQQALADFIYATSINAKYNAPDRDAVVSRLNLLKASVEALLGDVAT